MQFLQEITVWNAGYPVPNHIYYLSDDKHKAVGYIKAGTKKLIKFSRPINFDIKGRKFARVSMKAEADSVYFPTASEAQSSNVIQVAGSGGKMYSITKQGSRYTCTCPGFMFRSKCKHVEQVQK